MLSQEEFVLNSVSYIAEGYIRLWSHDLSQFEFLPKRMTFIVGFITLDYVILVSTYLLCYTTCFNHTKRKSVSFHLTYNWEIPLHLRSSSINNSLMLSFFFFCLLYIFFYFKFQVSLVLILYLYLKCLRQPWKNLKCGLSTGKILLRNYFVFSVISSLVIFTNSWYKIIHW